MFSHSTLLHPSQSNPFQINNTQKTYTSGINYNPFNSPNSFNSTPFTNQKPQDEKSKGGRRGFPPKYKHN
jgi:hypothetical protein